MRTQETGNNLGSRRFFLGLPLYYLAENMWTIVLLWLLLKLTHSPIWMAWGVAWQTIPMVVVGIWGPHRGGGRTLSRLIAGQVLAMALGAGLFPHEPIGLIAIAAVNGWLYARVIPAAQAYLMRTAPSGKLSHASARYELLSRLGMLLGPALGGGVLMILPPNGILFALAMLWAGVSWCWIGIPLVAAVTDHNPRQKVWSGFGHAVKIVVRDRFLGTALVIRGVNNLLWPAFTLAIPLLSLHLWHTGSGGFGILRSAWGLSTILGTIVVVPLLVDRLKSVYFLSWLVSGLGFLGIAISRDYAWALAAAVMGAFGSPLVHVALDTHIGHHIDQEWQGRLFALQQFIMSLLSVIGLSLVSWGLAITRPQTVLATAGILMMVAAMVGLAWWHKVRTPAEHPRRHTPLIDAGGPCE